MNQPEEQIICLLQPDFIEILREDNSTFKRFSIKLLDEGDVIHLRVSSEKAEEPQETKVAHEILDTMPKEENGKEQLLQIAFNKLPDSETIQVVLLVTSDDQVVAYVRNSSKDPPKLTKVFRQPSKDLLYSRSKGIIESELLETRKVAVIGLGSGGSHVALELAKAGIGNFVLVDYDRIELNNISRHACGVKDLGRLKTKAIRDRILDKNPFAEVQLHNTDINDLQIGRKILKGCDMIVAATDNIRSRLNINSLSLELGIPALYGKCAVRAAGGEVVIVRPHNGPCFSCVYRQALVEASQEEVSSFRQAREANPSYVPDSEVEATIQVGLSSDIIPISNMIVKLALVELCKGQDSKLASLENDFKGVYYIWANRRDGQYENYPEDGFHTFNQPSILRWYSMEVERDTQCKACQEIETKSESNSFFG